MRSSMLILCSTALLAGAGCRQQEPNAAQIEDNGAVSAENVIDDAGDRAALLARHAADLNAQAEAATGARREELRNEADAAMSAALNVQRSGNADAARIDSDSERQAQNAARAQ